MREPRTGLRGNPLERCCPTHATGGTAAIPRPPVLLQGASAGVLLISLLSVGPSAIAEQPAAASGQPADDPAVRGARVYRDLCASCHGESGEGVKDEFPRALVGERSVSELARYVEKRMPKGEPELCVGEDAEAVARFVHESFYSPIARARNRPPSVEAARLTARQYRNAVADLVGSFRGPDRVRGKDGRGIEARYFNGRRPGGPPALERTEPDVDLRVSPSAPPPAGVDPTGFAARWEGSLTVPETGRYDLIVRTDQAARLWLNDPDEPLIDAWVKSGDDTEYRASIFLIDGRSYPLRLDFTSAHQGVEKEGEKKPLEAFLRLWWKAPRGVDEPLPSRHLSTLRASRWLVVETPFPPEDRSVGYERGTSIPRAWADAAAEAAVEAAGHVAARLDELAGLRDAGPDRPARVAEFCRRLVERAFRRPLSDELKRLYVDRQLDAASDLATAAKRVTILALTSPRFLQVETGSAASDPWSVASRLSFALWDSLPDDALLEAAGAGRLGSREEVRSQAERMVEDPRFRAKLRQFLHGWLQIERTGEMAKDPGSFPGFDDALVHDLRVSLDLALEEVVDGERADFRDLLLSSELHLNGRLGAFYGATVSPEGGFQKVSFEPSRRFGVLSHPYVLSRFAYPDASSPIHRGVFIARNVLGRTLHPPPNAFAPLSPDLHPDLTTRERVSLQTGPDACRGCHDLVNPLGFSLESFDAAGRWREEEKGRPIDASGAYRPPEGAEVAFASGRELAELLAASDETHGAIVAQLFHHLVKQPILAFGPAARDDLRRAFAEAAFDVRRLAVEIAVRAALREGAEPAAGAGAPAAGGEAPARAAPATDGLEDEPPANGAGGTHPGDETT